MFYLQSGSGPPSLCRSPAKRCGATKDGFQNYRHCNGCCSDIQSFSIDSTYGSFVCGFFSAQTSVCCVQKYSGRLFRGLRRRPYPLEVKNEVRKGNKTLYIPCRHAVSENIFSIVCFYKKVIRCELYFDWSHRAQIKSSIFILAIRVLLWP